MSQLSKLSGGQARYELRFASLVDGGRGFAFPCDAHGHVDICDLTEQIRCNFFYARKLIGRELSVPSVALVG